MWKNSKYPTHPESCSPSDQSSLLCSFLYGGCVEEVKQNKK